MDDAFSDLQFRGSSTLYYLHYLEQEPKFSPSQKGPFTNTMLSMSMKNSTKLNKGTKESRKIETNQNQSQPSTRVKSG
jgi:hypothetical protein